MIKAYESDNYFHYRQGMYRPYLKALLRKAAVRIGSSVLDVGCGQGFFANLLRECGMTVTGIDISETGVEMANETYKRPGIEFIVGDINAISREKKFDCVFARSFSQYNVEDFAANRELTGRLMQCLKPDGVLMFLYNTKLRPTGEADDWRYHTIEEARRHFAGYNDVKGAFSA